MSISQRYRSAKYLSEHVIAIRMVMYKIPDVPQERPPPSGAVASGLDKAEAAQSGFMTSSASAPNPK